MKTESRAYSDATYKQFLAIESGEYKEKVLFVDMNRNLLNSLSLNEYVGVMNAYAEALFELGNFTEHIRVADDLIEISIVHNVFNVEERDLYQETLFQKAASLYNLERLDEATYILRELLKMNPNNESARLFLINCHVKKQKATVQTTRKLSIFLILLSACTIAVELLVVRPHFPEMTVKIEATRNLMFLFGAGVLIVGELLVYYRAVSAVFKFKIGNKSR